MQFKASGWSWFTLSPCAVSSRNSGDDHGKTFPFFLSVVTSLSSATFIPVTSCISSIHFLLGRPLLLPSPHASIIPFSNPSDRITCPKNPSFRLSLFVVAFQLLALFWSWIGSSKSIFFVQFLFLKNDDATTEKTISVADPSGVGDYFEDVLLP